jgi:hypothetical protein
LCWTMWIPGFWRFKRPLRIGCHSSLQHPNPFLMKSRHVGWSLYLPSIWLEWRARPVDLLGFPRHAHSADSLHNDDLIDWTGPRIATATSIISNSFGGHFIRLTQTGITHNRDHMLHIKLVEFFGTLSEWWNKRLHTVNSLCTKKTAAA